MPWETRDETFITVVLSTQDPLNKMATWTIVKVFDNQGIQMEESNSVKYVVKPQALNDSNKYEFSDMFAMINEMHSIETS